tara:strand:+ start:2040 stop:8885 length:6846 start_codon:yes stop_codon:yes gene_type:complete
MPFSNELLAAAGINPYENDKATPPPFLQNDLDKQLNQNQKMPATLDELADARGLKALERQMQFQTKNQQIKPYTYNAGKDSHAFYDRYHAFGQKTFDEIGFSPFKNNDAAFNAQTSWLDRTQRSVVHGFAPLFATGFVSGPKSLGRMLQGDFSDDPEDAAKYARAAAIAQDTSGGFGAFFNNTLMNFGYSAGIMSEAIVEELAISAATGGIGGALNFGRFASKMARGARGIKGFNTIVDAASGINKSLKSLTNINKAREFFNAAKIGAALETRVGKAATSIAKFANPAENLVETGFDIAKNAKQLQGWNKFQNATFKTAGALYRDVRNINMALSEARLEGGFQRNDLYTQLRNDYKSKHNGAEPSEAMDEAFKREAGEASKDSMLANTLLIFASNKVTFGNIMNPKTGLARMMAKKVTDVKKMAAGRTIREFTEKTLKTTGKKLLTPKISYIKPGWKGVKETYAAVKKQGLQKTVKGVIGYTKANLMEGVQESLQEVISDTTKKAHLQSFYSQAVGDYMYTKAQRKAMKEKGVLELAGESLGEQVSWKGAETFASGFVMGAFASPLNAAIPTVQQGYMSVFQKEKYAAFKDQIKNQVDRQVKSVNDQLKNDPLKLYDTNLFGLGTQTELAAVIEGGDPKQQRDASNEAEIKSITNVIEMGSMDIWTDHMESLKELTTEEYAEAFGLTLEQAEGHTEKLDKIINKAKEIEKLYKNVNERLPSPIDLNDYEKGTKEYEKAAVYHKAWEEGKKGIIFYNETYKDTMTRMQSVFQDVASDELLGKIDPNRVQALFKGDRMNGEIQVLESEIAGLEGMTDPDSKKNLRQSKETLASLKEFKADYDNFMSHFFEGDQVRDTGESEFVQKEISTLETQLSNTKNKSDRGLIQTKLDNLRKRSEGLKASEEKDETKQAIASKKAQLSDVDSKIDELNDKKEKLSNPEYYEAYAKDKAYAEKESALIDRQLSKLNKERAEIEDSISGDASFADDKIMTKLESSFKKYMLRLAKQSDDIILNDKIDDAFEKLVDYYRLGKESGKLADAINMLNDPEGFMDHVDRTYDWMYDMWTNREDYIRQNINNQLERLKFNELLNNMAAQGIYVDLDDFAVFKQTGVIPTEFFDDINKRVIKSGSPIYDDVANQFKTLAFFQDMLENQKTTGQKENDELARLNMEEQDEIKRLPRVPTKVTVRQIDNTNEFSVKVVNDQLSNGQSAETKYTDEGVQKTQVFFKDADGILRYDDASGEVIDLKMDLKFNSGEIFEIIDRPTDADVKAVNEKYAELRAELAERSVEESSKAFTPTDEVQLEEITPDTPIEAMPEELRLALIDGYDAYRARPENKNLFPDTLSEEDLQDKFKLYIKSESEAFEIIETYVKNQKLKGVTTAAGEAVVPTLTLPSGDKISADDATDAMLEAALQSYRFAIQELSAKTPTTLNTEERELLAKYKAKANVLSAYIENKRVGELSPELRLAKARIDLLIKEQDRITLMKNGYKVDEDILRRVSNVVEGLKDKKYEYTFIEEIRGLFNTTLGSGGNLNDFMAMLRSAKLPGFSEKSYTAIEEQLKEILNVTTVDQQMLYSLREDLKVEEGEFGNPERAEEIRNQIATLEKQVKQEAPTTNQADTEAKRAKLEQKREEDLAKIRYTPSFGEKSPLIFWNKNGVKYELIGEAEDYGRKQKIKINDGPVRVINPNRGATGPNSIDLTGELYYTKDPKSIIKEYETELAALEQATTAPAVEATLSYEDLVSKSRNEMGVLGANLSFTFFGNLQNAIKNGQIKSKEDLNVIINNWNESAGYQGYPNEMSDAQSNMLLQLSAGLPDVTPVAAKKAAQPQDTLLDKVERLVKEETYNEETEAGNYVDVESKELFAGGKPVFDETKITKEAFDNLFGENGLFQIMKQWMDTNKLVIVSKGLVVYDKSANVAGEIDFLLTDGKNFYIVDLKTGSESKWDGYNDPNSREYEKKVSNMFQQAAYINLLHNMLGIKATAKILPVQLVVQKETGKILKASKPTSPNALKAGKILIDLPITEDIQAKVNEAIPLNSAPTISTVPLSNSVSNLVNDPVADDVEGTDYEEGGDVPTGPTADMSEKVKQYETKIDQAKDYDALERIELEVGMDSLNMTAEDLEKVQMLLDIKRNTLLSGGTSTKSEKTWDKGNHIYSENTIFVEKGKNKGDVFLSPFDTAVISDVNMEKGTVTIKPYGKTNQMTISIDMLNKMFKLKSDIFTEEDGPEVGPADEDLQNTSKESTDVVSTLLEDKPTQAKLEAEVSGENVSVDTTINDLLEDLDC